MQTTKNLKPIKQTAVGLSSFTLTREGEFTIQTFGTNHCGTKNPLKISYELVVKTSADSLDSRGFLFDQTKVDAWFQSLRGTELSCEQLTIFCGRAIYKLIRNENPLIKIEKFKLSLSPEPHKAILTFEYGE